MTTLSDIRDRVRRDLRDTDAAAYRWDDAPLERHIARALREVSLSLPREAVALLATTAGSREVSLAGLSGLLEVEAVAWPAGEEPRAVVGFTRWGESLFLQGEGVPAGEDAEVWYTAEHVLDEDGSTLGDGYSDLLAAGAGAYAALEMAAGVIDRLNTGGEGVAAEYAAWGRAQMTAFRALLRSHGRPARLGQRTLVRDRP